MSFIYFNFKLVIFADDTTPRWVTTTVALDYSTVAIADKFGNIAIIRFESNLVLNSQQLFNRQ